MNKLFVHIGTPKTGTTALQKYLYENRNYLKQNGWSYMEWTNPILKKNVIRSYENGSMLLSATYGGWTLEEYKYLWDELREELDKYNVIVSEECIWNSTAKETEEVIANFKKEYDDIVVIVYLRRQDIYAESLWNQGIKEYLESCQLQDFLQRNTSIDYLKKIEKLAEILGEENVIIRVYEKEQLIEHDIVRDFLKLIGLDAPKYELEHNELQNERLDGDLLELKRLFNDIYKEQGGEGYTEIFQREFFNINYAFDGEQKGRSFLSREEHDSILDKFADDNETIAKRYLKRENGILFYDSSIPKEYASNITLRERFIVEAFAKTLASVSAVNRHELEVEKNKNKIQSEKIVEWENILETPKLGDLKRMMLKWVKNKWIKITRERKYN